VRANRTFLAFSVVLVVCSFRCPLRDLASWVGCGGA
jgi:hypothetical protein